MGFKLEEIKTDEQFRTLWPSWREAFNDPGTAMWPLFMGDWQPNNEQAREDALRESCDRWISWHRADPTSTWLQVIDEATGEVVAGGRWSVYTEKPHDDHQPMEASWFAPGEPREVATKFVNDFLATAVRNANKPHAFLNTLFTHPRYRRQGAASMIMDWGFERARAANLPVYVEATKEGKPLYEKYGMKPVQQSSFEFDQEGLGGDVALRSRVIDSMTPFTWWSMMGSPTA